MIGRSPRRLRLHPCEPKLGKIESLDKRVDHTNRIIFADPVIKALGQQRRRPSINPLDKLLHPIPRKSALRGKQNHNTQMWQIVPTELVPT
jgi:hypothetical protein